MESYLEYINCEVCGSSNYDIIFHKQESRSWWIEKCADDKRLKFHIDFCIVKCRLCGMVFVNPRLKPEIVLDIYANYWKSQKNHTLLSHPYGNYVCRQLASLVEIGKLLDFGCGWGQFLHDASALGWDTIGVEFDNDKVDHCLRNGLKAINADLLDGIFEDSTFNAIIAHQVFEHVYKPNEYLNEIRRILKPSGVLYISVPNFGGFEAILKGSQWKMIHPVSHLRYFTVNTLTNFLFKQGFSIINPIYLCRFRGKPMKNLAYKFKTFFENKFRLYLLGLSIYARNYK